ncbi:TIGR01459 family HAD-type hydrolase [Bradyrhizobium lablabi]|uniref:TIGR01459 family HAD-type hydrolase n=1 Tax=Bradyrhizobium lablabi TaxID=722472 RepID=UPI001BAAAD21|nr:TIGR01459 family HAD-type hydrolase [Bradyrhizobium lablabi]MBR0694064.1 TIGR01459 family HAD-type hydrolase [Bradyrhizobium lablabi]
MKASPVTISGLRAIAERFDHVLVDQWGTLHEGKAIFPEAYECVTRLREAGKRVLVLSNSGKRANDNEQRLAALGLARDAYDGMLSSGEVAWNGLRARECEPFNELGHTCFLIARGGDRSIVDGVGIGLVEDMRDAEFILLGGLDETASEPEHWRDDLTAAAARRLPMLCANPDLIMFGAGGLMPAPGALAAFYQSLGGIVKFVGKPYAPIFAAALERLGNPKPPRVLVVGDSLDHDIAGGRAAGMLTALIRSGVHRELLAKTVDLPRAIRTMAGSEAHTPHWTIERLTW